jgi:hypothetical protein
MVTKTYYGKLDCLSSTVDGDILTNEYYKNFVDFMSYLTASNVASLVAWNSGANAVSASFNQRGFWNQNNTFGINAYSVWRFPSSSSRPFDWYLYTQVISASALLGGTFNVPISGYAQAATFAGNNTNRGILMQAAVCFSGTTSFNPWNGSGSTDGANNAGNPRWIPGGTNRNMYVFPRSNDGGGTAIHISQKSNGIALGGIFTTAYLKLRYHFLFDGDSIVVLTNNAEGTSTNCYNFSYVGPFELRNSLTSSGINSGSFGMIVLTAASTPPNAATFTAGTLFGDTAGSATTQNGGIGVPIGGTGTNQPGSGSKAGIADTLLTFQSITYQPNFYTGQFDEFPINVGGGETSYFGLLGTFNTGLMKLTTGIQTHDVVGDGSRACFGGINTLTDANQKITVPWTGSAAPGASISRTGLNYTWTKDYDA